MRFRKWMPKVTPSGLHDNGYWELSAEFNLSIPFQVMNQAVIEKITVKTFAGMVSAVSAYMLTINGVSYKVEATKNVKELF